MRKLIKEWVPVIVLAIVLSLTIRTYIGEAVVVPSGSMLPTIHINDRLAVDKLIRPEDLQRGDIVVFYPPVPEKEGERFIKRLIGIGGDTIEIKNGALYRNGQKVDEPYIKEPMNYEFGPVTVPPGKFFFLGDNRNESYDSHLWPTPFVDADAIEGTVRFRFYPFTDIGAM
ncbi:MULTISPECIES: signal peptidase I [Aneurinibacillus]|uniref:Signal peptidase I n=1 Tax=Aneurinibacillus thermoaerophilus TaxID=143495 RepID=A0A1G8D0C7_ANETH|nr:MULTISPECIES: signal peptidase I [Aneurinibacillus]AMA72283.1 S26 family signal peptidase [Aneurinibacillus sp. XH2]MED0674867.1 signal peptidase I [Aneurinibacillus thermoaerophilus]MED0679817.1 signal peptidase I [Aneurinibacillus thermoaerophilus]MED0735849.1 signal peptidase I [Aneurinibacillus thermoaerophilus]MED0758481.1 signal peptidase I [Aneurinibacillus thermoaerophilus]